jgi:hypothetical protein
METLELKVTKKVKWDGSVYFYCYINGDYECLFSNENDALDWMEKINEMWSNYEDKETTFSESKVERATL